MNVYGFTGINLITGAYSILMFIIDKNAVTTIFIYEGSISYDGLFLRDSSMIFFTVS